MWSCSSRVIPRIQPPRSATLPLRARWGLTPGRGCSHSAALMSPVEIRCLLPTLSDAYTRGPATIYKNHKDIFRLHFIHKLINKHKPGYKRECYTYALTNTHTHTHAHTRTFTFEVCLIVFPSTAVTTSSSSSTFFFCFPCVYNKAKGIYLPVSWLCAGSLFLHDAGKMSFTGFGWVKLLSSK